MTKKSLWNLVAACVLGIFTFLAIAFQWLSGLDLMLQDVVYQ